MAAKSKQTYEVIADGWLAGTYHVAGDKVELYPEQAQYDLPPHGSMLRLPAAPATPAAPPAPASKKKSAD